MATIIIIAILVSAVIIGGSIYVISKGYSRKWDE